MVSLEIIGKCVHVKVENYKFLFKYTFGKMYISFFFCIPGNNPRSLSEG